MRHRSHPLLLATLTATLWLGASVARADTARVELVGGGLATGEVVVYIPGERITLRGADGQTYTFEGSQIAHVSISPDAPPTEAAPHPLPPPPLTAPAPAPSQAPNAPLDASQLRLERARLADYQISMAGPITVLTLGTVFVFAGTLTLVLARDPTYGDVRRTDYAVGMTLFTVGAAFMLWGIPFTIKRGIKRGRVRRRMDEIDRQLQFGTWSSVGPGGQGRTYGAAARFYW